MDILCSACSYLTVWTFVQLLYGTFLFWSDLAIHIRNTSSNVVFPKWVRIPFPFHCNFSTIPPDRCSNRYKYISSNVVFFRRYSRWTLFSPYVGMDFLLPAGDFSIPRPPCPTATAVTSQQTQEHPSAHHISPETIKHSCAGINPCYVDCFFNPLLPWKINNEDPWAASFFKIQD